MKRTVVHIVILIVVCMALGAAVGMTLERKYIAGYFPPKIARVYSLTHPVRILGSIKRTLFQERTKVRGGGCFERICQALELSPEQSDKVKAILEETREKTEQASDEFRTRLEQVRTESDAEILKLLNPEQKEKFKGLQEKRRQRCS